MKDRLVKWVVDSSMWIFHLFDDEMVRFYAVTISVAVGLLAVLWLIWTEGALLVRDNGDGTETEFYLFGKRTVKIEGDEDEEG